MALSSYAKTNYVNGQSPSRNASNLNKTEQGVYDVTEATKTLETSQETADTSLTELRADVDVLKNPVSTKYLATDTSQPTVEGEIKYNSNTHTIEYKDDRGVRSTGQDVRFRIINLTGVTILKGKPVKTTGISNGILTVSLAQANTFVNSIVGGITTEDVLDGAESFAMFVGPVGGLSLESFTDGLPLYLSGDVAGEIVNTPPDIVTRLGRKLSDSEMMIKVDNNVVLPTINAFVGSQNSPVYDVVAAYQDIADYISANDYVLIADALAGSIEITVDATYKLTFTTSITFPSNNNTRVIVFGFDKGDGTTPEFEYTKNIPNDATEDSLSFSVYFNSLVGDIWKMKIKGDNEEITIVNINYAIESTKI